MSMSILGFEKKNSRVSKAVKKAEKWLLRDDDAFVTLTEKARETLFPDSSETGFEKENRPVEVLPCCVDRDKFKIATDKFRKEIREKLGIGNRLVVVYVTLFGGFSRFAKEQNPDTFELIQTQEPMNHKL